LLDSLIHKNVHVSEQEAFNYYEMNKDNFLRAKPEIRALHILVADENQANEARRKIVRGDDFEIVAKEISLDYEKKSRIDMGYFSPDDVVPEIARSIFSWRVGSITRPIQSEFGYHIFKILDQKEANTLREFDDVKDLIMDRILAKKKEELYKDLITSLKSKIEVKTNFDYLKEMYRDSSKIQQSTPIDSL